jgi:hypothetical protein
MKLVRTTVPYVTVERLEGPKDEPTHRFWDWETAEFQPPQPGAQLVARDWDSVSRSVHLTWLIDGVTADWTPALAIGPAPGDGQ